MKFTANDVVIFLFILLWIPTALYVGVSRELDIERETSRQMYNMLTAQQQIKLKEDFKARHWRLSGER